ncbi:hypothetical protein EDC01DRAFT_662155 [Geopyxis carbonaria]|nr:hypothetical protein EDC01DRAFT_662155 [Geopyxis carbonaria]
MSIDLQWEAFTAGPGSEVRAERIRAFVHEKFQLVPFPKFIKSVQVHSFSFGTIPPDIEIKDICDPYAEFYEQDEEDGSEADSTDGHDEGYILKLERELRRRERKLEDSGSVPPSTRNSIQPPPYSVDSPRIGPFNNNNTKATPHSAIPDSFTGRIGVTGVTTPLFSPLPSRNNSNLHYFHSALSSGFSGVQSATPSSVVNQPVSITQQSRSVSPGSTSNNSDRSSKSRRAGITTAFSEQEALEGFPAQSLPRLWEPRDEDTQIIARVQYAGNVRLELTAELLFEYPIANFVALPVRLVVTGCTFDGLACIAYIRRRAHFCFLDEDPEKDQDIGVDGNARSLLKQINVESEIGEKGKGKQVLKNVGKVERFVLDQVRRIFDEEFVFPSSWTFLV